MRSSRSAIVVVPGYPAELIQEFLGSHILSYHHDFDVLLPPGSTREYDHFIEGKKFFRVRFFPSPGRKFFSTIHLKWLRKKLRSYRKAMVLITKSPYQDFTIALIVILVFLLSGKKITMLRNIQTDVNVLSKSTTDINCQSITCKWLCLDLNFNIICNEIFLQLRRYLLYSGDLSSPWDTWEIIYFFMFAGLIMRRTLSNFFSSLVDKSRGK